LNVSLKIKKMPYFQCRLATDDGHVFAQSFFSPSLRDCQKHFEEEGLCILSIKRDWKRIQIPALPFEKRIKDKDFIMFNQEFIALIKAGYPILKCLEIIARRTKSEHLKERLTQVESEIRAGKALSEAFSPFEDDFSKVYTASLMAGEKSGNLAGTLTRFIAYTKTISQTKTRIRTAMTYPVLLLLFSLILIGILIHFILPRFSDFYADFEAQLPAVTTLLMSLARSVRRYTLPVLGLISVLALIFARVRNKEKFQIIRDRIKLSIPFGRWLWLDSAVSLFTRTLGLLLEGGISLLSAIGIASQAVPNRFLVDRMRNMPDHIKNGESLFSSLAKTEHFPELALDMIRIGESSANLDNMLADVAELYDEQIRSRIDTFVSLIEPIVIIFMGLIVAGMLLSVYLPIFNIIRVVQ